MSSEDVDAWWDLKIVPIFPPNKDVDNQTYYAASRLILQDLLISYAGNRIEYGPLTTPGKYYFLRFTGNLNYYKEI